MNDIERRHRYLRATDVHPSESHFDLSSVHGLTFPVRAAELDLLTEAVNAEHYRLHAVELQQRYDQSFVAVNFTHKRVRGQHAFGPPPSDYENIEGIDWERVAMKVRPFLLHM